MQVKTLIGQQTNGSGVCLNPEEESDLPVIEILEESKQNHTSDGVKNESNQLIAAASENSFGHAATSSEFSSALAQVPKKEEPATSNSLVADQEAAFDDDEDDDLDFTFKDEVEANRI